MAFSRYRSSFSFLKSCMRFLGDNKDLIKFPLMSMVSGFVFLITLFCSAFDLHKCFHQYLPQVVHHFTFSKHVNTNVLSYMNTALWHQHGIVMGVILFAVFLITSFITLYINSALLSCIMHRLKGEKMSMYAAFASLKGRMGAIIGWSLLNATVGTLIRSLENSHSTIQNILMSIVGLAWALSSYFVMPFLIMQKVGPIQALKQSGKMFGKGWRRTATVNTILALVVMVIFLFIFFALKFFVHNPELRFGVVAAVILLSIMFFSTYGTVFVQTMRGALFLHFFEDFDSQYFTPAQMDSAISQKQNVRRRFLGR